MAAKFNQIQVWSISAPQDLINSNQYMNCHIRATVNATFQLHLSIRLEPLKAYLQKCYFIAKAHQHLNTWLTFRIKGLRLGWEKEGVKLGQSKY